MTVLGDIVGTPHVRDGGSGDAVDGITPRWVAMPASNEECAELLRLADRDGLAVVPRGGGTKLGWGNRPRQVDVIVDTSRLNRVLAHEAGDLVVIAQAGTPLATVQDTVAGAGQMLGIDSLWSGATLGGIIAANASGPRRVRFGTMKDLLIGITVVLPGGTIAHSGGKVVKNVAGYDLGKLFTGSLGTLGLITETIFRLHARPPTRRAVQAHLASPSALGLALQDVLRSHLTPTALEVRWDRSSGRLICLFESIEPSVAAQSDRAASILSRFGPVDVVDDISDLERPPWARGQTGLKIMTVPARLPDVIETVLGAAGEHGIDCRIGGHAGVAVLLVALDGGPEAVASTITTLRSRLEQEFVVVLEAPAPVKERVDVWGNAPGGALMRRIKEQFDPGGIMSPGRFVGGI